MKKPNYFKVTNEGMLSKVYGGELKPCPHCKAPAVISEWHGIGDVRCSVNEDYECPSVHYSGKWNVSKAGAIRIWNSIERK